MKDNKSGIALVLVVCLGLFFFLGEGSQESQPPRVGGKLLAAFQKLKDRKQAAADALQLARLSEAQSTYIQYDASKDAAQREYTQGSDVQNLRIRSRDYLEFGRKFTTKYPDLPDAIADYFAAIPTTKSQPLDDHQRKAWVEGYDKLGKDCRTAAAQLTEGNDDG